MTEHIKLIADLESAAETERPSKSALLMHLAAEALKELTTPKEPTEIPYKAITELYTSTLSQWLPPAKGMPPMRKRMIAQRWQEDPERRSIGWWADFWIKVSRSDFLCGRSVPRAGHENWRPNFDWFIKPGNMCKVSEGSYNNRDPRANTDSITRFR